EPRPRGRAPRLPPRARAALSLRVRRAEGPPPPGAMFIGLDGNIGAVYTVNLTPQAWPPCCGWGRRRNPQGHERPRRAPRRPRRGYSLVGRPPRRPPRPLRARLHRGAAVGVGAGRPRRPRRFRGAVVDRRRLRGARPRLPRPARPPRPLARRDEGDAGAALPPDDLGDGAGGHRRRDRLGRG